MPWEILRPCAALALLALGALPALATETSQAAGGSQEAGKEGSARIELIDEAFSAASDALEIQASPAGPVLRAGDRSTPLEDVLFVHFDREPRDPAPLRVIFADGDSLRASVAGGGLERLRLLHAAWTDPVSVALEEVTGLVVPASFANDADREDFVARQLLSESETDRLFLVTGEPLAGLVEAFEPTGVRFARTDQSGLLYPWDKIRGLRFAVLEEEGDAKPDAASAGAAVRAAVRLADGSELSGKLTALDPARVRIEHATLGALEIPTPWVTEVALLGGRCQFLSDLEPASANENLGPLLVLKLPHRRDRGVLGGPLRLGGETYSKGLGVHAYSRLEYDLAGEFSSFQSLIGLDDTARPPAGGDPSLGGAVVFRVWLDGQKIAEETMSWRDPPRRLQRKIAGGRRLALEVLFGEGPFDPTRDRAAWAEARVVRTKGSP